LSVILTWQSVAGHTYQAESRNDLSSGSWSPLGSPVPATSSETSVTNIMSQPIQFFRIQEQ
jgi:hypothetical protein